MPQKTSRSEPPEVMTWPRATPVLVVAALFDALRFMCTWLIFFGPALGGLACTIGFGGSATAGTLCTAGAGIVGVFGFEIIGPLGIILAEAVGLIGWLALGGWLAVKNPRIFKENALWFGGSLLLSEIPFVNGVIPAFTLVVWRMYHNQIKIEKAAHKKWEASQAAAQRQEQQRQLMAQSQATQQMQSEQQSVLDNEWSDQLAQQEAKDEEAGANEQMKAANDDKYGIPDDERRAA